MKIKKYRIAEKAWSFRDDFKIFDENEMVVYKASGKKFAWKKSLQFTDWQDRPIYAIQQKVWAWVPTFFLREGDRDICKVSKKWSFKPKIELQSLEDEYNLSIRGNIWGNKYQFYRNDEEVAFVSRDIWKLAGSYGVAIHEGEQEAKVLATVVIIDLISDIEQSAAAG